MRPDSATPEPGEPTAPEPGEPTAPEPGGMPHDRLHIAMFTDFPPGSLGGISTAVDDQRRALERLGHRVTVFAPAPTDPEAAVPTWLVAVPAPRALSVNGFPFVVPTRGVLAAVENELIRRAPIDVVHVHTTYGVAILGAKIARGTTFRSSRRCTVATTCSSNAPLPRPGRPRWECESCTVASSPPAC